MIKTLLNADEEPPPGIKVVTTETIITAPPEMPPAEANLMPPLETPPVEENLMPKETSLVEEISMPMTETPPVEDASENFAARPAFEVPEDAQFFAKPPENIEEPQAIAEVSQPIAEPLIEKVSDETVDWRAPDTEAADPAYIKQFDDEKKNDDQAPTIFQSVLKPESAGETIRQSGLAYSAAIILFASVVFMLVIGWFADLLLGSSPWGVVGGIILGGIIGFIQFFRITSQIFKK